MRPRLQTDVLAPAPGVVFRFALYTRISSLPAFEQAVEQLRTNRATIEEAIRNAPYDACVLAGSTYDDAFAGETPGATPSYERLIEHVRAARIHHVFLLVTERAGSPMEHTLAQMMAIEEAGANVHGFVFYEDATWEKVSVQYGEDAS